MHQRHVIEVEADAPRWRWVETNRWTNGDGMGWYHHIQTHGLPLLGAKQRNLPHKASLRVAAPTVKPAEL